MSKASFEQSLDKCWRFSQGAMYEQRPYLSPSFRMNFKHAYLAGMQAGLRLAIDKKTRYLLWMKFNISSIVFFLY